MSEALRAFVRNHVRKTGTAYRRGNGARLSEALAIDAAWVTDYTDEPPKRHADIDQALTICRFFNVRIDDFAGSGTLSASSPRKENDADGQTAYIHHLEGSILAYETIIEQLQTLSDTARFLTGSGAKSRAPLRRKSRRRISDRKID